MRQDECATRTTFRYGNKHNIVFFFKSSSLVCVLEKREFVIRIWFFSRECEKLSLSLSLLFFILLKVKPIKLASITDITNKLLTTNDISGVRATQCSKGVLAGQ